MKKILFATMAIVLVVNVNAKVWRVNNTAGVTADFKTFIEAQEGASVGDTLMFEGSTLDYNTNNIDTLKKTLTLVGSGYFLQHNYPEKDDYQTAKFKTLYIAESASGAVVTGINFLDVNYDRSIIIDADNVVIDRNFCEDDVVLTKENDINNVVISRNVIYKSEIFAGNDHSATNILIVNNILTQSSILGALNLGQKTTASLINNYIGRITNTWNSTLKNNIIMHVDNWREGNNYSYNIFADELPESGVGNVLHSDFATDLFIDSPFTDYYDSEFQILESSVAAGAGEGGIDCGAFGGTSPYVLSGLPAVPVITDVVMPQSVTTELSISIKAKVQE